MFSDPTVMKAMIMVLFGVVGVETLALIILALKKNTYLIDDPKYAKKQAKKAAKEGKTAEPEVKEEAALPEPQSVVALPEPEKEELLETVITPVAVRTMPALEEEESEEVPHEETKEVKDSAAEVLPITRNVTGMTVKVSVGDSSAIHTITAFPCLIGRESAACNLVISEKAVSRRHARFTMEDGHLYIEDVSEHNGTFLNETKLPPLGKARLHQGDTVTLGRANIYIEAMLYE